MNKVVTILVHAAVFAAGVATGYFIRKRGEMRFVEVTEEELAAEAEKDTQNASKTASEGPESASKPDIGQRIEELFASPEVPSKPKETHASEGIGEGQKIAYFNKWKAQEAQDKYDTRTKEEPEDVVADVEEGLDPEFMKSLDDISDEELPEIEGGTMADWHHWTSHPEDASDYDTHELTWYEKDNVICDDRDEEVERPEVYIGYDIRKQFERKPERETDDPNVRIIINHKLRTIYHVTRVSGSWSEKRKAEEFGGGYEDDNEEDDIYNRFRGLRQ